MESILLKVLKQALQLNFQAPLAKVPLHQHARRTPPLNAHEPMSQTSVLLAQDSLAVLLAERLRSSSVSAGP